MNKKAKVIRTIIVAILVFLFLFPVLIMVNTSLQEYDDIISWPPQWFKRPLQWQNYYDVIFGEKTIMPAFFNSLIISLATMFTCVILASLAAYGVTRFDFLGKRYFLILILIAQMFSSVILVNAMYIIFRDLGLLNTRLSLVLGNTASSLPMTVWLLYSYFSQIPLEYEEAAWMDGSSRLQGIKNIILPLAMPGIITAGLFAFLSSWGDLVYARTFTTEVELRTVSQALMNFQDLYKTTWERQMAASVITTIPPFIIFSFIQRYLIKGLTSDGVKG